MKTAVILGIVFAVTIIIVIITVVAVRNHKLNKQYNITYDLNGGYFPEAYDYIIRNSDTYTFDNLGSFGQVLYPPEKKGYEFVGWTRPNSTEPKIDNIWVTKDDLLNETEFTAHWKEATDPNEITTIDDFIAAVNAGSKNNEVTIEDKVIGIMRGMHAKGLFCYHNPIRKDIITFNNCTFKTAYRYFTCGYFGKYVFNNCKFEGKMANMFEYNTSVKSIEFNNCDASEVTNMASLCYSCTNLSTCRFNGMKFEKLTNIAYAFDGCRKLTDLDIDTINLKNCDQIHYAFGNCESLYNLQLTKLNLPKVKYCSGLLTYFPAEIIDLSNLTTNTISSMENMFYGCKAERILMPNLKTPDVWHISGFAKYARNLKYLDIRNMTFTGVSDATMAKDIFMFDSIFEKTLVMAAKAVTIENGQLFINIKSKKKVFTGFVVSTYEVNGDVITINGV